MVSYGSVVRLDGSLVNGYLFFLFTVMKVQWFMCVFYFKNPQSKVVVRCKTSYTGLFSFLAIPLLMGDIMIEFMNMIDINGQLFLPTTKVIIMPLSVNIMITTAATTTATTAAPNNNNNNNNNNGGSGSGSGSG